MRRVRFRNWYDMGSSLPDTFKDISSHLGGISGPNSTAIMTIFWQACGDRSGNYLNKLAPRMVWNGGLVGAILRSETY